MTDLSSNIELVRNVVIVGHLHHGKTSFVDSLVQQTHASNWDVRSSERYTDVHELERERGCSIKSMPVSLVLNDLKGKSFLMHIMDTPGRSNSLVHFLYYNRTCEFL